MIVENQVIRIASWTDRFLAGLVDCAILAVGVGVPLHLTMSSYLHVDPHLTIPSLALFAYNVISEYKFGQTIGKKTLGIKTIKFDDTKLSLKDSSVNSFGKVFLLPIDFIGGLVILGRKRQRLFNKLSDTIVIKLDKIKKDASQRLD